MAERRKREKETKKQFKIRFYDVVQTDNKEKRIYTLEPRVYHGNILFSRDLSREFFGQLMDFPKAAHDDCPDCLEILWSLAKGRYKPSPLNMGAM